MNYFNVLATLGIKKHLRGVNRWLAHVSAGREHGSMAAMPHLQAMEWDFTERLSHITRGTTEAYYNYDGSGQRVRKVVEKGNGIVETRLYLGGFEVFRKNVGGNLELERETLHIMDDTKRIAFVETKTADGGNAVNNPSPIMRYQFGNNIESAALGLDENANIISYEEYYPYGDTSYRAGRNANEVSQKRYRYTGKEKDDENGLYYHGARYYASWLGRWTATDPAGLVDGVNLYAYCKGNPVKYFDPDGKEILLSGSLEQRQLILDNMQKLTNDKLGMRNIDDNGSISTVIIKEGRENTDKNLKTGSNLIRKLNKKGDSAKSVIIGIVTGDNFATPPEANIDLRGGTVIKKYDWENAMNKTGTTAIIGFNPNHNPAIPTKEPEAGLVLNEIRPTEITLAHELVHSYHINEGTSIDQNELVTRYYRITEGCLEETAPKEELYTIGIIGNREYTENKILKEQGLELRGGYDPYNVQSRKHRLVPMEMCK